MDWSNTFDPTIGKDTEVIEMHPCFVSGDFYDVSELVFDREADVYIHKSKIDMYVNSQGWTSEQVEEVKTELEKQKNDRTSKL